MQNEMEFKYETPAIIGATPVYYTDKQGKSRITWYYQCLACNNGRNLHQSTAPKHLHLIHGCSPKKAKHICMRSREYYYKHRYDEDIAKWEAKQHA